MNEMYKLSIESEVGNHPDSHRGQYYFSQMNFCNKPRRSLKLLRGTCSFAMNLGSCLLNRTLLVRGSNCTIHCKCHHGM